MYWSRVLSDARARAGVCRRPAGWMARGAGVTEEVDTAEGVARGGALPSRAPPVPVTKALLGDLYAALVVDREVGVRVSRTVAGGLAGCALVRARAARELDRAVADRERRVGVEGRVRGRNTLVRPVLGEEHERNLPARTNRGIPEDDGAIAEVLVLGRTGDPAAIANGVRVGGALDLLRLGAVAGGNRRPTDNDRRRQQRRHEWNQNPASHWETSPCARPARWRVVVGGEPKPAAA